VKGVHRWVGLERLHKKRKKKNPYIEKKNENIPWGEVFRPFLNNCEF